jgi:NADH-quinone oxidoreductase subunit I
MTVTIKEVDRPQPDLMMKAYLPGFFEGLGVTTRHFVQNLGNMMLRRKSGANPATNQIATLRYPEETQEYAPRYRGHHRLMLRDDGQVRCVACNMCATACPADCLYIVADEHNDSSIEKAPSRFEIDLLVCIYCGFCEEACPCDAIRMDSGIHVKPFYSREDQRVGRVDLMAIGSPSIAKQGGNLS